LELGSGFELRSHKRPRRGAWGQAHPFGAPGWRCLQWNATRLWREGRFRSVQSNSAYQNKRLPTETPTAFYRLPRFGFLTRRIECRANLFDVRHFEGAYMEDDPAGVELPDDAAAREFGLKVIRG
jgi:hypothetical protein